MNQLKVNLWGREIGRLIWNETARRTYFMYNPEIIESLPDLAPLISPASKRDAMIPVYGDERPLYQRLPPFIADSLPDSWGNTLFDKWVRDNKIPRNKLTPLYKLMFIGKRAIGALDYEPCTEELNGSRSIDIKSLYNLSTKILEQREPLTVAPDEAMTMQSLLAVGTSAGGRQMKAIVAINSKTGEIRSGQADGLPDHDYCIIKFGDKSMPIAEIDYVYYLMVINAGIEMEDSRLISVDGINHFITRRYDRNKGRKVHAQSLAAINPDATSYEDLITTCRLIDLTEKDIAQVFTRMVFNIMANNTDDHNKNFSFLLGEEGKWRLAPAYDMTFIFDRSGLAPNRQHRLSLQGKTYGFTKADLINFANENGINRPESIINQVAQSIRQFNELAMKTGIGQPYRRIINKTISKTLVDFGFDKPTEEFTPIKDGQGRTISSFSVIVNSKGHYVVEATIDGNEYKKYIRAINPLHKKLAACEIDNLSNADIVLLVESILPPANL